MGNGSYQVLLILKVRGLVGFESDLARLESWKGMIGIKTKPLLTTEWFCLG